MSINRFMLLQQASPSAAEPESPEWLLQMLREVMTAVAKEEGDTLKKAGMIARLGSLYLRASGAAELKRAHRELARRCTQLEEQLAALQAGSAAVAGPEATVVNESRQPARGPADPRAPVGQPRLNTIAPVDPDRDVPSIPIADFLSAGARASPPR